MKEIIHTIIISAAVILAYVAGYLLGNYDSRGVSNDKAERKELKQ